MITTSVPHWLVPHSVQLPEWQSLSDCSWNHPSDCQPVSNALVAFETPARSPWPYWSGLSPDQHKQPTA